MSKITLLITIMQIFEYQLHNSKFTVMLASLPSLFLIDIVHSPESSVLWVTVLSGLTLGFFNIAGQTIGLFVKEKLSILLNKLKKK